MRESAAAMACLARETLTPDPSPVGRVWKNARLSTGYGEEGGALNRRRPLGRRGGGRRLPRAPRLVRRHGRAQNLGHAGPGRGREQKRPGSLYPRRKRRPVAADRAHKPLGLLLERHLVDRVDLRQRDNLGFLSKPGAVSGELAADSAVVGARVRARGVDEMNKSAAPLDKAEEPVAEAMTLVRPLDQARNVGEHKIAPVDLNYAEPRMKGGERIIGDLRPGGRNGREEGRLAGVRQAGEAGVGDQLQP